jgi:hypothetical protein
MKKALLLVALLAGCETAYKDGVPNERSTAFWVPVDSKLVLHRGVEIPPYQHAAYLQGGKLLPWYEVNLYAPYCALAVQAPLEAAKRVGPDEFVVRRVSHRSLFMLAAGPLLHAARGRLREGMTYEVVATVMAIHSDRQPEASALTCASWGLPQGMTYVTVEQIRRTLGAYMTLELAPQAPRGAATLMPLSTNASRMALAKATAPG